MGWLKCGCSDRPDESHVIWFKLRITGHYRDAFYLRLGDYQTIKGISVMVRKISYMKRQPGLSCRTCTRLNIASSPNTHSDEASAISLIASLKFFFLGPNMTLISNLYKLFKLNSQCFSFFNVYLEGSFKMSRIKILFMISNVSKGLFRAD